MSFLEYAPAPESRAILNLRDEYGLFIDGEFRPGTGESFATISPADEKHIATIATASEADVDAAVAAARRAHDKTWSKMSGRDRGKYLFRIARLVQERARELAVAESLDNGKPIKESRDVDVPLVAAWFFYYAGWADKLDYAGLGANPRSLGVAGQVIPWNFPLLMLAWKIAPALAAGNTVVIKPAETTPLSALIFAEILQQADLPPGVVNIVTGRRRDRCGAGAASGCRQGRLHRLDRRRPRDREGDRGNRQEAHARARRQGREHRVRGRADRSGDRGHRQRHLLQPGPRLLRGQPAARAGVDPRRRRRAAEDPPVDAAHGRPARQEHRHRRDQLARAAATASASSAASARRRAPSAGRRTASSPRTASGSRRRSSRTCRRRTASRATRSSGRCCRC